MPLLVVGTVGLDTVQTPTASQAEFLGGSAVHFSIAASFFTPANLVSVVGDDWPDDHRALLCSRGVNIEGLKVVPGGKTFRWAGRYHENMNDRDTLATHLNVYEDFDPVLPDDYRRSRYVFLANGSPQSQHRVLDQLHGPRLVVADTMNLWIDIAHDELMRLFQRIDGLVINDSEAKMLSGTENLVAAGHAVRERGPKFVIIKKGEHGAMFFAERETYVLPAFPTERVIDPTGAGDSFAGGMMGYLAERNAFDPRTLKSALAYGILTASFSVEGFGVDRLNEITRADIEGRMEKYRQMLAF
jgi:sugar/nucleoside kinase (ribokinase family)